MTNAYLVLRVHWHDSRYHGVPDWPPSPARVYQALVAGASRQLDNPTVSEAFLWLEGQAPPVIGVPLHKCGQSVTFFVPNNDLDTKGGDPANLPDLRVAKEVTPKLLSPDVPATYAWRFTEGEQHAWTIAHLADSLYQLGRGVDMAWAQAEVRDEEQMDGLWAAYQGVIYRPTTGGAGGRKLACPEEGTFGSLRARHDAQAERFVVQGHGRKSRQIFVQPPKVVSLQVAYDNAPARLLFELRPDGVMDTFGTVGGENVVEFTQRVRDEAASLLMDGLTDYVDSALIEAAIIGRRPGEQALVPSDLRVRIVPLPSIGHEHVDPHIRRLVVEVPQGGPLRAADVRWAFSRVDIDRNALVEAQDSSMLQRYLRRARRWQSVTPLALPATRRRIDPARRSEEAKSANERGNEEAHAVRDLMHALRHAKVDARVIHADVQREPLRRKGRRAEAFAAPPRFPKERLWHVDVVFDRPVSGPLVLGDGRFLGLGVMAPAFVENRTYAWRIVDGLASDAAPLDVAMALRRAVIARVQDAVGPGGTVPSWVSGHEPEGAPARAHQHLYFLVDLPRGRLLVVDPLKGRGRAATKVADALDGMNDLRAGRAGRLVLAREPIDVDDPLFSRSRAWVTVTPYRVERHSRKGRDAMIERDVVRACADAGLPRPNVRILRVHGLNGRGVDTEIELDFGVPVEGPVLLGRTRHKGGGLFEPRHGRSSET